MRKVILLSILGIFISLGAYSQDPSIKLGIKLAPTFGSTRIVLDDPDVTIDNDGSSLKMSFGLVVDKELAENYVFSTGLMYIPKKVSISLNPENTYTGDPLNASETYKLQYVQIPATLKLFTNEVSPDTRIYFQLGTAIEVKLYEEADSELVEQESIDAFQTFNLPIILGAGMEYRAGVSTVLFGGISYQRGLTNIVKNTNVNFADELIIKSTLLSIDLGVKF
jgi:hypothetical protein